MPAAYDEDALAAAVERLMEGERLHEAEAAVAASAPDLQRVLAEALASGGWFEESHQAQVDRVASIEDPRERATALATLLAEETRIGMMVGVAVGWALGGELGAPPPRPSGGPQVNETPNEEE
jgi:hypothetical protein